MRCNEDNCKNEATHVNCAITLVSYTCVNHKCRCYGTYNIHTSHISLGYHINYLSEEELYIVLNRDYVKIEKFKEYITQLKSLLSRKINYKKKNIIKYHIGYLLYNAKYNYGYEILEEEYVNYK